MAAHGARRLKRMNENLNVIIGVELMCAAQGIEFRKPLATSKKLAQVMKTIRAAIPAIEQDRYMADDITQAAKLVADGKITADAGLSGYCTGESL